MFEFRMTQQHKSTASIFVSSETFLQTMDHQKQSHQTRALLLKTLKLQSRQPCTNICQILTPIICLLFSMLIRKIAIDKIPTDNDSIFTQFPTIPQKFNDYTLEDFAPKLVKRVHSQWYSYQILNASDEEFIGEKIRDVRKGMLGRVPDTFVNTSDYNLSRTQPFVIQKWFPPVFIRQNESVNIDLLKSFEYFNDLQQHDLRNTTALDKLADGAITFHSANQTHLLANLKINDLRLLEYHRPDGITRIRFFNTKLNAFQSYYLISQGFLCLQDTISLSYITSTTNKTSVSGYMYMPFYNSQAFVDMLVNTVTTIIFPISLSLLLPVFLYMIVLEKEEKLIQMMRMNGMKMRNYWLVGFFFNFAISLITNLVFFLFGFLFMQNAIFQSTSKLVLGVVALGWMLAQIGMATFFQVFLTSSRAANIIGYLISIWTNLIGATLSIAIYQYPRPLPMFIKWYPTFSFTRVFYLMLSQCSADRCYSSLSSLSEQAKTCIIVLYVSFVVFQLLGMYLFEVVPQQYGTRQPLTFPLKWLFSKPNNTNSQIIVQRHDKHKQDNDESAKAQRYRISDVVNTSDYPLIISDLRKVYSNGKVAVQGLDLLLQDKEVFGLLGPNGAGKTTLISMITGVFQSSSGDCLVGGFSIKNQIDKVHLNIGVCPQFDVLWPQLTVEEHLYFYSRLRGTPRNREVIMVQRTLEEVNLTNFRTFKANQLSGGMKRRLSVGISMVGEPRIVFLDEPTTGLDPENRRHLWDVLNKCRQNRALFLTTHLMEQADALCNRVGIITKGVLRTIGTQQKLKNTYGNGYYLSLNLPHEKQKVSSSSSLLTDGYDPQDEDLEKKESVMSFAEEMDSVQYLEYANGQDKIYKAKVEGIKKIIREMFPQAVLDREISGYLRFNMGDIVISQIMKKLGTCQFQQIRNNWGLTNSNLEDVFLSVVRKYDTKQQNEKIEEEKEDLDENLNAEERQYSWQRKPSSVMTQDLLMQRHSINS